MARVTTVILAGGQGTRLQPLTTHHCKPAIFYGGRYRLIDIPISNSINSNLRQIFILAQHLATEIEHHVHQTYHFESFKPATIDVLTPQEDHQGNRAWFEGTADAVRKNLSTLLSTDAEYFLILSGDQLYHMNFQSLIQFAVDHQSDLTIASIAVDEKDAKRMGLLRIDADYRVIDFVEKPKEPAILKKFEMTPGSYLGSMGIYVFRREALIDLLTTDLREDFGYHLIHTAVSKENTHAYIFEGYWEDIGTVASYYEANLSLTQQQPSLNIYDENNPIYACPVNLPGPRIESAQITKSILGEGSLIEASQIIHSILGLRCRVGRGTILKDSILIGNATYTPEYSIGEDCWIEKAIIDEKVRIGNRVRLINQKKIDYYDGDGVFIRDGIILVVAGTTLPDDFNLSGKLE